MAHFGGAVNILHAQQVIETKITSLILIFSLLNIRKKTAAAIAGICIGALCLWGLSMWQNISRQEILDILLAIVLMLGGIIVAALLPIKFFRKNYAFQRPGACG